MFHRPCLAIIIIALVAAVTSGCSVPGNENKIDNSTTWQQKAELALAESKKPDNTLNDNAEQTLLASLNQLAETHGQTKDPEFEKLMLYYLPDIVRYQQFNPKKSAVFENILNKKVEICRRGFGEDSVQNADALFDLYCFESVHDHEKAKAILAELRDVNRVLKEKGTPLDTSDWNAKKEAHADSVTGRKSKLPTYAVATKDIPAGGVITRDNTKEVSAPYSQHPRGALPGGGLLFGCCTVSGICKDSAITTEKVCRNPGPLLWDRILPSDSKWIQASKLAQSAQEKKDYKAALKYFDDLADELTRLADGQVRFTDYCDNCYLCTLMSYDDCAAEGGFSPKDRDRSVAWHKRVIAALTKLCPEGNDNIKYEQQALGRLTGFAE